MAAKTYVYWNLHKDCFSFRSRGLVYQYLENNKCVSLCGCSFKVSEKGRQRVLKEKRKNVHAFVAADIVLANFLPTDFSKYVEVTYNPYKYATFVRKDNGEAIYDAKYVVLEVIDNKPNIYAYAG
jgi:hypothetical protein